MSTTSPSLSVLAGFGPLFAIVFLGFLAIGVPLAALSLEVGEHLGYSPIVVGCLIGLQSVATVLTRHRAGTLCDHRGARTAVMTGLPIAASSGLLYMLATLPVLSPAAALLVLIAARIVAGLGESLFVTGTLAWGIARLGLPRTGKVMSWQGIALYGSLGVGAPLGLLIYGHAGLLGVGVVTVAAPLLAWPIAFGLAPVAASGGQRVPFHRVLGLIWRPGLVLALATVPFAAMAAFLALDYAAHGWPHAGAALFGFGAAYVAVRLVASGLADRFGPAPVALGSLLVEVLGQVTLWLATGPAMGLLGAVLTGAGFSLVFPAMGVLATRSVPAEQRGRAVGNFVAFFDLAIGATGPLVGLVTLRLGIETAFLVGTLACVLGLILLPSIQRLQRRG